MATATSFASPQMNWDAPDPIKAFARFNQCYYYNRHTKELPELHRDQAIYVQDPVRKTWNPARVIDQGETPRSYLIETGTGSQLQRNRIHPSPNNASNNLANNSSNWVPQGSMTAQAPIRENLPRQANQQMTHRVAI